MTMMLTTNTTVIQNIMMLFIYTACLIQFAIVHDFEDIKFYKNTAYLFKPFNVILRE